MSAAKTVGERNKTVSPRKNLYGGEGLDLVLIPEIKV
jgi:hypothetical protein